METQTTRLVLLLVDDSENLSLFEEFLLDGLARLNDKLPTKYFLHDLYRDCEYGASSVCIIYDSICSNPMGFFLLAPVVESEEISVHISCAYSPNSHNIELLSFGLQKAEEFGIIVGANSITFETHRKGWKKVAVKLGFVLAQEVNNKYLYTKRLSCDAKG